LGEPADLDFRADLAMIAAKLRTATEIRKKVADYSTIQGRYRPRHRIRHWPSDSKPSSDDVQLLKEAKQRLKQLESFARHRVELLSECVDNAEQVDQMLRDDREQSRIDLKRDDVRGQLRALLSGAELTSPGAHSDSVDMVISRVEAFREVRGLMRSERSDTRAGETPEERTFSTRVRRKANNVLRRFRR
jgi:hypothetical protein